jgi:uncharacterized damage-inducible protein DinB
MFTTLSDFLATWAYESGETLKLLETLTDASLATQATPDTRSVGRLAWHIAQTIPEMMGHTGLRLAGPGEHDPVPATAAAIREGYGTASASLADQIRQQWTDASLQQTDPMYGDVWSRAQTLQALVAHQIHHRGQLTILMRLAGLPVHGIYGPAREEWAGMGMQPPAI